MKLFNKIKPASQPVSTPQDRTWLTINNIEKWSHYYEILKNSAIKFVMEERLRYNQGDSGYLMLIRLNKDEH